MRWLLMLLVLATALPMIGLLGYYVKRESELAMDRAQRLSKSMSEVAVAGTLAFILEQERVLSVVAQRPIVREMNPANCDPSFVVLMNLQSYLADVKTVDLNGLSVCSTAKPADSIHRTIGDPSWLHDIIRRNTFVAGRVQKDNYTGQLILVMAQPVRDDQGAIKGALQFVVNLAAFNPVVPASLPSDMVTIIMDADGTVIARSAEPEKWVGKSLLNTPLFKQIKTKSQGWVTSIGIDGVERLYAFTQIGKTGWTVSSGIASSSMYASVNANAWRTALFSALILLLSTGLSWLVSRKISQPIAALQAAVQGVTRGELNQRAPVSGPLEIADTAVGMNAMLDQLLLVGRQLHSSEAQYRALFDASPDVIYVICEDKVVLLNPAGMRLFGVTTPDSLIDSLRNVIQDRQFVPFTEHTLWIPSGERVDVEVTTAPFDFQGRPANLSILREVTERKKAENSLRESEARYARVIEGSDEGFWDWDIGARTLNVSPRFESMLGYATGEWHVTPSQWSAHVHPDDLHHVMASLTKHTTGASEKHDVELRVKTKSGDWKWILLRSKVLLRDARGRARIMSGTHTDITERKKSEALIWQQANTDALTGLPNRRMLRDRMEQAIKRCKRENTQLAVLFIDLDLFKEINDTLGHAKGDALLIKAAHRLRSCVREFDTVAHQGGDEFTVVLEDLDARPVELIAQNILISLEQSFQLGDDQAFITASIGITVYPDDASDIEGLFQSADQALYAAKAAGRNRFSYFTSALQESAQFRMRLTNDLRRAMAENQLKVYYQPIINLSDGHIYKAEALIRWLHPTRGLVSPSEFIPLAESSGLIVEIGDWIFRQAAEQVKRWRGLYHPMFQISVNKSPMQFTDDGLVHRNSINYLHSIGLPGNALVVEITEGLLLASRTDVREQLQDLRRAGIGVSLDDFGTGYSSLSYLQKYDIDYVKIDQSFVRNLLPFSKDLALCKAIIVMAHELGMKVVAEGVETVAQRDLLTAAGCDYGQGYLFSRPVPVAQFEALLTSASTAISLP